MLCAAAALLPAAARLHAQSVNESGAQFLLLPIGPRLVSLGGAGVADRLGGESLLANPAALAYATRREGTLLYGQDIRGERAFGVATVPSRRYGTFAVAALWLNAGEQEGRDLQGNLVGTAYIRNVALQASYASVLGRRLGVGLTFRVAQERYDCTGICSPAGDPDPLAETQPTTSMLDVGVQYDLRGVAPVRLGVAVRHLGQRLQVRDREQSDALPTQLAFGARADLPRLGAAARDLRGHVLLDVVRGLGSGGSDPSAHLGAEIVYRNALSARAGWLARRGEESGPSVGFGYAAGRFGIDLARQLTGFSVDAGEPPTYVGLRYAF